MTPPLADRWRLPLAGAVALLLGVGFGRFVFTPLITPLVENGWFSAEQTATLGAINLLGYLAGAAAADRYACALGARRAIASCLLVVVVSLAGCAWPWGMVVYGFWRFLAGAAAAVLTIVSAPEIMSRMRAGARPAASAIVFTGIGVGTMAVSLIVPALVNYGIAAAWLFTAGLGGVLAGISWWLVWRHLPGPATANPPGQARAATPRVATPWLAIGPIIIAYGLGSIGYVPHSLYWVDYIARELGRGLTDANRYWLLLGLGGVIGPAAAGYAAHRLGFVRALVGAFVAMTAATAIAVVSTAPFMLGLSSLAVGATLPAIITLTAGAVHTLAPADRGRRIWGWATLSFAAMQAVGGFAMARLYAVTGSYAMTLLAGVAMLGVGACCVIAGALRSRG